MLRLDWVMTHVVKVFAKTSLRRSFSSGVRKNSSGLLSQLPVGGSTVPQPQVSSAVFVVEEENISMSALLGNTGHAASSGGQTTGDG